jgi:hypothetical protein
MDQDVSQSPLVAAQDEINLTDLFRNIWRQRGLVMGITLVVAILVMVFHFAKSSFALPTQVDYSVSLTFLEKGKYPNGTEFSPQDIIAPSVLSTALAANKIDISSDYLAEALSVSYSNSLLKMAEDKLSATLSNVKTPEEMRSAASTALEDMQVQSRSHITVSLNLQKAGLTSQEGRVLVADILETWARMTIDRGMTNVDIDRPLTSFVVAESTNLIDIYDNAANYLNSLKNAVKALSALPGSGSMIVDGYTLEDVRRELVTLDDTDISPLRSFAYTSSAGLSSKNAAIKVRLFSRQRLLGLEHERLTKLIDSYDKALAQLTQSSVSDQLKSGRSEMMGGAQFDQSFLNSLLDLGSKLGGVQIRDELFKRRTKAVEDLLSLEKEMAILNGTPDNVFDDLDADAILRASVSGITENLNTLQKQLNNFIAAYREQILQSGGRLFVADAAPAIRDGNVQLSTKIGLHLALGIILGGMLGMMAALIRAAMIGTGRKY